MIHFILLCTCKSFFFYLKNLLYTRVFLCYFTLSFIALQVILSCFYDIQSAQWLFCTVFMVFVTYINASNIFMSPPWSGDGHRALQLFIYLTVVLVFVLWAHVNTLIVYKKIKQMIERALRFLILKMLTFHFILKAKYFSCNTNYMYKNIK